MMIIIDKNVAAQPTLVTIIMIIIDNNVGPQPTLVCRLAVPAFHAVLRWPVCQNMNRSFGFGFGCKNN